MNDWIIHLIERGGYWGIAFLMALENIIPPIPSELIMGVGGIAVARGTMTFWPLLIAGTVGSTLGNYFWFLIGDRFGYRRLHPLIGRWGKWLAMDWREVEATTAFFRRHGQWVIFAMRFSPVMRTMVSLPAGLSHMRHGKFLAFTFAGAAVWNTLLIHGGRLLARYTESAKDALGWIIGGLTIALLVWYVWRVVTWDRRQQAGGD